MLGNRHTLPRSTEKPMMASRNSAFLAHVSRSPASPGSVASAWMTSTLVTPQPPPVPDRKITVWDLSSSDRIQFTIVSLIHWPSKVQLLTFHGDVISFAKCLLPFRKCLWMYFFFFATVPAKQISSFREKPAELLPTDLGMYPFKYLPSFQ